MKSAAYYRVLMNSARCNFDRAIRMARYETRNGNIPFAMVELKFAAYYRRMIIATKVNMYLAMERENNLNSMVPNPNGNWVGCGHDPSGNEY